MNSGYVAVALSKCGVGKGTSKHLLTTWATTQSSSLAKRERASGLDILEMESVEWKPIAGPKVSPLMKVCNCHPLIDRGLGR